MKFRKATRLVLLPADLSNLTEFREVDVAGWGAQGELHLERVKAAGA